MAKIKFPNEFLGRCQTCLNNAYLDAKPCRVGYGVGQPVTSDDCLIRRAQKEFTPATPSALEGSS